MFSFFSCCSDSMSVWILVTLLLSISMPSCLLKQTVKLFLLCILHILLHSLNYIRKLSLCHIICFFLLHLLFHHPPSGQLFCLSSFSLCPLREFSHCPSSSHHHLNTTLCAPHGPPPVLVVYSVNLWSVEVNNLITNLRTAPYCYALLSFPNSLWFQCWAELLPDFDIRNGTLGKQKQTISQTI